jgi:glycosyltransferase involved in cell wall biosynthesis
MTVNELRVNGVSEVILLYSENLNKAEFNITLITGGVAEQYQKRIIEAGITVISSPNRKKNQLKYRKELIHLMKESKIDIIHAHGNSATLAIEMLAAKQAGVPIRIAHSHNTTCTHKLLDKLLRPVFYSCYTDGVACGEEAGKWMFGLHPFQVIKNGVNIEDFRFNRQSRQKAREQLAIENMHVIGHIGRFTYQKNHELIIDIFKRYLAVKPNSVLLLVGNGPLEDNIKKLVKEKGIDTKVIFYGTSKDTPSLYSAMDTFIFPSRFEGLPLTLIEAQANGLPCIISNRISEEVNMTSQINVLPIEGNLDNWIEAVGRIQADRIYSSDKAISLLEQYGYNIITAAASLNNLYKDLICKRCDEHVIEEMGR